MVAAAIALACGAGAADDVANGGFESSRDFSGWQTLGQCSITGSRYGTGPVEGFRQAVLETVHNMPDNPQPSRAAIESFLGLPNGMLDNLFPSDFDPGDLPPITEGAAIKQTLTLNRCDRIIFKWNFLTEESQHPTSTTPDVAFVSLTAVLQSSMLRTIANTTYPGFFASAVDLPGTGAVPTGETGFQDYILNVPKSGTYVLGFGVMDALDTQVDSAVILDAIWIDPYEQMLGDANLDGEVGIADLAAIADHYGDDWEMGDFNQDGQVGIADLAALADNYGRTCLRNPVPEPVSLSLLAVGGLALLRRRRAA
jgi:hypothetical protein